MTLNREKNNELYCIESQVCFIKWGCGLVAEAFDEDGHLEVTASVDACSVDGISTYMLKQSLVLFSHPSFLEFEPLWSIASLITHDLSLEKVVAGSTLSTRGLPRLAHRPSDVEKPASLTNPFLSGRYALIEAEAH
ncbi:hypothetical protein KCU76_g73, partial [Aureobasidium melanogenum]